MPIHLSLRRLGWLATLLGTLECKVEHPDTKYVSSGINPLVSDTGHLIYRSELQPIDTVPSTDTAAQLLVLESRIGPIPVDSSMGYIARILPNYAVEHAYLEATPIIDWSFMIRGFTVEATQQYAGMNLSHPAYGWVVDGPGTVVLRGGIRLHLPTVWSDLRRRLPGPVAIDTGEMGTRATFCALPRLAFPLEVEVNEEPPRSRHPDSLAPTTRVSAVEVWTHEDTVPCVE